MGLFQVEIQVAIDQQRVVAQTLESFGLGVDPLGKRLVPVDPYLA